MRILVAVAFFVAALGLSGCSQCNVQSDCPSGEACIRGATCATACSPDGGTTCPAGTTCQMTSANCHGTACTAALVYACL